MIRSEYSRFLETLNDSEIPQPVRKIANLVADNLNDLVPLTTHQGQRIKQIAALAQANWDSISSEIKPLEESHVEQAENFSMLTSLEVGPFRGFARQEAFDLRSRLVLIYGPNGTGKSSFCEALEYGLLGSVAEAESKRFRDQSEYLKNAYLREFSPPTIYAMGDQNNEILITPNEQNYRYCFVEKNRIDSFSRIAAQPPAKQTELISTLFGLDSFTEFVRNFTAEIDDRYIDKKGRKAELLTLKQQELSGAKQQIETASSDLQLITSEEAALASKYREGINFSQMVLEINGTGDAAGAVEKLEYELRQPLPSRSNVTVSALEILRESITENIQAMNAKQRQLSAASQQVSFKQLYEAVIRLQANHPDICPACKTPLNQVNFNPYILAGDELNKLQQLSVVQQDIEQLQENIRQSLYQLLQTINTCLHYYSQNNPIKPFALLDNVQPSVDWWTSLHQKLADGFTAWDHLASQVKHLEERDKNNELTAQQRSKSQSELNILREYLRQITVLQTRKESANRGSASAREMIENFQKRNAELIAEVEEEKAVVAKNREISSAYERFVYLLNDYSNNLPALLVADLGETVVELYNSFNRNDSNNELLADVRLPLVQNQRLEIAFKNKPKEFFDALHVLSEGHIRCLGLAILLAKNLKEESPVLIFDDPVNAIDDDHKESIRRTLFEDQYFSHKQILLTCHGEEFFKDIHNLLSAQAASEAKSFSFLPRLGEQHIRINFNCAPRNYILAAREHMNRNEIREALAKSRQALEALAKGKVWKYVSRYGDGNLSLRIHSPSAPIELRNLTEQLKSKIGRQDFSDQNKGIVLAPLDALLGLNGGSREWRYLNKGTHEEDNRAEFDRYTVEEIILTMERLDAALE